MDQYPYSYDGLQDANMYDDVYGVGEAYGSNPREEEAVKEYARMETPWSAEQPHSKVTEDAYLDVRTMTKSLYAEKVFRKGLMIFLYFVVYVVLFFVILSLHQCVECANDVTYSVEQQFIDQDFREGSDTFVYSIDDVDTRERLWLWAREVWADGLFDTRTKGGVEDNSSPIDNDVEFFSNEAKIVQLPYIEQQRVSNEECNKRRILVTYRTCLNRGSTDRGSFSNNYQIGEKKTSRIVYWFTGPEPEKKAGVEVIKVLSSNDVKDSLRKLESEGWIDRQTSWVKFNTVLWNPNHDIIVLMSLVFTQPVIGQFQPYVNSRAYKGYKHGGSYIRVGRIVSASTTRDYVRIALECMFLLMTIMITLSEVRQLYIAHKYGMTTYLHFNPTSPDGRENLFDLTILIGTYLSITWYLVAFFTKVVKDDSKLMLRDDFNDLWGQMFYATNTILIILFTFHLLKYARFNSRWKFLTDTLGRAIPELGNFILILLIILLGYSFSANYYWGANILKFNSPWRSFSQMLQFAVSTATLTFDDLIDPTADSSLELIPFFLYWTFMFLVFFILVNMFLAIVTRSYESVMSSLNDDIPTRSVWKRVKDRYATDVLNAMMGLNWIQKARSGNILAAGSTFLYSRRTLRITLHFQPGNYHTVGKAERIFIVLPTKWRAIRAYTAEWHVKSKRHDAPHNMPVSIVHDGLLVLENNLALELNLGNPKDTIVIAIPLVLRSPKNAVSGFRCEGDVEPCFTHDGNVAIGLSDAWEGCPFVVLRKYVAVSELSQLGTVSQRYAPRKMWEEIQDFCSVMFEPPFSEDEDDYLKSGGKAKPLKRRYLISRNTVQKE